MEAINIIKDMSAESMDVDPKLRLDRRLSDSLSGEDDDVRPHAERSDEEGLDDSGAKESANGDDDDDVKLRKKHRRGKNKGGSRHNKKWRPYNKLSWSERKELDERETERACLKREERFASGHPVAPYNTTQFLMEDHNKNENISPFLRDRPNLNESESKSREGAGNVNDSNDAYYDSPNDEESFIAKDFSETYENIHAERLQTMSKVELVKEYIELEAKVEKLESKLHEVLPANDSNNVNKEVKRLVDSTNTPSDNQLKHLLQQEIERLKQENDRLRNENQQLRGGSMT
ncbi:protein HEXIM1-like [Lineus longissimus]|uniref:protein HEXIM1-like n=1 Tax=Lineus longissimus TaxID=88925 RepID=UPI00315CE075